jgi:phage tail-like protein
MAISRDNPYGGFNFIVTADPINGGDGASLRGGFQEISGLNMEVTVAEYRNGNEPENHTRKLNTLAKTGDVTLKRGVVGTLDLFNWIKRVRDGDQTAWVSVTIQLMDEAHTAPVMTWKLTNARPTKYTAPTFNAKTATDVAIEELVLASDKVEME